MPSAKNEKTNVMRILDQKKILYTPHFYDHTDGLIDAVSVAAKLNQPPEQVFKTLVTRGSGKGYFVFIVPAQEELDLKAAARAAGQKSIEMIHVSEINAVTGYIRGGCSPIGMKKLYPTILDESALQYPSIMVSAGKIGAQVELSPQDLLAVSRAKTAPIATVREEGQP
ncbi:MAG TPA: Cys-tRNA(Pro) deacylase [Candidatus Merdivicinus excrementipullorum]|uniref:Cys-tRNA(Pro)/Cys-tRNA(Cys) deacylase n=1 Tax=Candidatus Merdivicinus excrementipullorum TaxID=2840867 RepID=A0A9D1FPJ7_9FIRM|nr:Cys-tRNA(Pro) deacylase [Candidatus Merdivicinus excrementipullorum]